MNEEKQRIKIAEACGWTKRHSTQYDGPRWYNTDGTRVCSHYELPDYLNDLNAMHEAEEIMSYEQKKEFFYNLSDVTNPQITTGVPYELMAPSQVSMLVHATAAQRAEAFLKTLNLWEEEE